MAARSLLSDLERNWAHIQPESPPRNRIMHVCILACRGRRDRGRKRPGYCLDREGEGTAGTLTWVAVAGVAQRLEHF